MPHDVPSTSDHRMLELEDQIKFNDLLLAMETGKMECEDYHSLPRKSIRKAIMFKKVTRKMGMEGNFLIPCNEGGTKDISALVDQGSDVNVMTFCFMSAKWSHEYEFYFPIPNEDLQFCGLAVGQGILEMIER
ncbi:hypothetical protein Tco_1532180 [Tanacetum coccineum]